MRVDGKATQKLNRSGSRDEGIIASTLRSRSRFIGSVENPITGQIMLQEKECMKGEKEILIKLWLSAKKLAFILQKLVFKIMLIFYYL